MDAKRKTREKPHFNFVNDDFIALSKDQRSGITTLKNLEIRGFKEVTLKEWRRQFYVDEDRKAYVYSKNRAIGFNKRLVDRQLDNFIGFLYGRKPNNRMKSCCEEEIKVLFCEEKPLPIVFYDFEGWKACLIIAPQVWTE